MFGFLRSARGLASRHPRVERSRLHLEQLEDRLCPAAPVITQFTAVPLNSGQSVQLSGTVQDENPGAVLLNVNGVVFASTTTDSAGNFSLTTTASALGTVSASAMDAEWLSSNTANANLTSQAPSITLGVTYGSGTTVTLSGAVTDEDAAGCTVYFSGKVTGSTTTNSAGQFSYTAQASGVGLVEAVATDVWGVASGTAQVMLSNQLPGVTLSITQLGNGYVNLNGTVTDDAPGGLTVSFGGDIMGSATTDGSGNYSYTTPAMMLGTVTASVTDIWNQTTTTTTGGGNQAPVITISSVVYGSGRTVTISGTVADEAPGGLTVMLAGAVMGYATTNSDGTFSLTTEASMLGAITAMTTDAFMASSNTPQVTLTSNTPTISNFQVNYNGTQAIFSGQVADESSAGLTVYFGGISSLFGLTATVGQNGTFALTVALQPNESGSATADVSDWWWQSATQASAYVQV